MRVIVNAMVVGAVWKRKEKENEKIKKLRMMWRLERLVLNTPFSTSRSDQYWQDDTGRETSTNQEFLPGTSVEFRQEFPPGTSVEFFRSVLV